MLKVQKVKYFLWSSMYLSLYLVYICSSNSQCHHQKLQNCHRSKSNFDLTSNLSTIQKKDGLIKKTNKTQKIKMRDTKKNSLLSSVHHHYAFLSFQILFDIKYVCLRQKRRLFIAEHYLIFYWQNDRTMYHTLYNISKNNKTNHSVGSQIRWKDNCLPSTLQVMYAKNFAVKMIYRLFMLVCL